MFDKGPSYENRRSIAAASAAESSDECLSRLRITSRRASCLLVPAPPAPHPCSGVLHAHAHVTGCWRVCACMHAWGVEIEEQARHTGHRSAAPGGWKSAFAVTLRGCRLRGQAGCEPRREGAEEMQPIGSECEMEVFQSGFLEGQVMWAHWLVQPRSDARPAGSSAGEAGSSAGFDALGLSLARSAKCVCGGGGRACMTRIPTYTSIYVYLCVCVCVCVCAFKHTHTHHLLLPPMQLILVLPLPLPVLLVQLYMPRIQTPSRELVICHHHTAVIKAFPLLAYGRHTTTTTTSRRRAPRSERLRRRQARRNRIKQTPHLGLEARGILHQHVLQPLHPRKKLIQSPLVI